MRLRKTMLIVIGFASPYQASASGPMVELPAFAPYDNKCTTWSSRIDGIHAVPLDQIRAAAKTAQSHGSTVYLTSGHKHYDVGSTDGVWATANKGGPYLIPSADDETLLAAVIKSIGVATVPPYHTGDCISAHGEDECVGWAVSGEHAGGRTRYWVPVTCDDVPPVPAQAQCSVSSGVLKYDFLAKPYQSKTLFADLGITCNREADVTLRTQWEGAFEPGTSMVRFGNGDYLNVSFCDETGLRCQDEIGRVAYTAATSLNLKVKISYTAKTSEDVQRLGTLYVDYN